MFPTQQCVGNIFYFITMFILKNRLKLLIYLIYNGIIDKK